MVARRSGRNPLSFKAPSADGAIPGQRPWPPPPPPTGVDGGGHMPARKHERTANKERRAAPVCAAAGRQLPFSTGRLVPLCRAGACPRRRWGFRLRPNAGNNDTGYRKRPPSSTRYGVGTAALGLTPWGLRPLRRALRDNGVFRWLRPAGVSRRARRGSFARCGGRVFRALRGATGALPLDPAILGCPPPVGKSGRRGIFRQSKV